jgi:cytochrome c556
MKCKRPTGVNTNSFEAYKQIVFSRPASLLYGSAPISQAKGQWMRRIALNQTVKALIWWVPGFICATVALAQLGSAADVIKERQQGFKSTGAAFKAVKDSLQRGNADPDKIREAAQQFQQTSDKLAAWFPPGSGPNAGARTAARPEIWSDPAGFGQASDQFADEARKFAALAASGAVTADTLKALGASCGGCHDKYRVKQD